MPNMSSKSNGKIPRVGICLPKEIVRCVSRIAKQERRSFSNAIVRLVELGLAEHADRREMARANTLLNRQSNS